MSAPSRRWILRGRSSCKSSFSRRAKLKLLPLPGEVRAEPRPLKHGVKKEGAIVLGRQRSARRAWFARVGIFGLINQRVSTLESPPVRGRGSKHDGLQRNADRHGRPPCGGVDRNNSNGIAVVSPTEITLQAPTVKISASTAVDITGPVNANGAEISTQGEITDALGVVLGTHVHSGVSSGTSDTGKPVT